MQSSGQWAARERPLLSYPAWRWLRRRCRVRDLSPLSLSLFAELIPTLPTAIIIILAMHFFLLPLYRVCKTGFVSKKRAVFFTYVLSFWKKMSRGIKRGWITQWLLVESGIFFGDDSSIWIYWFRTKITVHRNRAVILGYCNEVEEGYIATNA